jgi:flagellar hook protein FlgE
VLGYLEQPGMHAIQVGSALMPPQATGNITLRANLNAEAAVQVFDPTNPTTTSNFSSTTALYDSLGRQFTLDIYWNKAAPGTWEFHAMTDGGGLNGGTPRGDEGVCAGQRAAGAQSSVSVRHLTPSRGEGAASTA